MITISSSSGTMTHGSSISAEGRTTAIIMVETTLISPLITIATALVERRTTIHTIHGTSLEGTIVRDNTNG